MLWNNSTGSSFKNKSVSRQRYSELHLVGIMARQDMDKDRTMDRTTKTGVCEDESYHYSEQEYVKT